MELANRIAAELNALPWWDIEHGFTVEEIEAALKSCPEKVAELVAELLPEEQKADIIKSIMEA